MKLGITTWSFESLPLADVLSLSVSLGFNRVDIAGFHQRGRCSFNPHHVGADPSTHAKQLNELKARYGVEVADYFPQFGASLDQYSLNDPDPEVRGYLRKMLQGTVEFCQLAGIPGISLSPGVHHLNRSVEQNLETSAEEFAFLARMAENSGVTIRVEPHMHAIADTPERTQYILNKAPATRVTLDYAHFLLQYISFERIHQLLPFTDHVHVRQARMGKMQTRTAEGTIDYPDIISRLAALNFKGTFALEYVHMDWFDCNQVDCLNETLNTKAIIEPLIKQAASR
jgi:sugar phosphate isomerase/epimerase